MLLLMLVLLVSTLSLPGCTGSSRSLPQGWSGVTIDGDTLFLGTREGQIVAIDATDNLKELWTTALEPDLGGGGGCSFTVPTTIAIYSTPTVWKEKVYITSYLSAGGKTSGKIYALNVNTGTIEWEYPGEGTLEDAFIGSPLIVNDILYAGGKAGTLYALDATDGSKLWQFDVGSQIWATPAISGDTLFIGTFGDVLYALDAATGLEKWQFQTGGAIVSQPLVSNGMIYLGCYSQQFYAIDAASGEKVWEFVAPKGFWAEAQVAGDNIYIPCLNGNIYVLDTATGNEKATEIKLGSFISSTPVVVGNELFVATNEGRIFAIDTTTNQAGEIKKLRSKEIVNSGLIGSGDTIYIHSHSPETLYAIDPSGAEIWRPLSLQSE